MNFLSGLRSGTYEFLFLFILCEAIPCHWYIYSFLRIGLREKFLSADALKVLRDNCWDTSMSDVDAEKTLVSYRIHSVESALCVRVACFQFARNIA